MRCAMRRSLPWFALCSTLLVATLAPAATRLDDASSPRAQQRAVRVTDDQGREWSKDSHAAAAVLSFGTVDYRLLTAKYVGRRVRIYFEVPAHVEGLRSPRGLEVQWQGRGRFAAGRAYAGDRALVWTGIVRESIMAESIDLTARLSLRDYAPQASGRFGFESYFVIEEAP